MDVGRDDDLRLTALQEKPTSDSGAGALVEYASPAFKEEEEDLEIKLRRIVENVPVRVSNTSGSSDCTGSADFHQCRQMRWRDQDWLSRMDLECRLPEEERDGRLHQEGRKKAAEERTVKSVENVRKRSRKRKEKKESKPNSAGEGRGVCRRLMRDDNT
ncbi:hypothetical protein MLD38_032119 [Melastoma candidum]|uniref:Uncharacterized protein n=1 Tax=Melastoma candidum TaxID=119954 RepID=A0ACB9M540_9MYRT|nr:hypothetical protein MLD38_032119 [Melastoma candidum]